MVKKSNTIEWRPQLIADIAGFCRHRPHVRVVDAAISQAEELYDVERPGIPREDYVGNLVAQAIWLWLSWRNTVVSVLPPAELDQLTNARNRVLFSEKDVKTLGGSKVGIAGLSVGSRVLEPLAHGPELGELRLADMDVVSATSLNRLPAGLADLGTSKVVMAARLVTQVRPQANVVLFEDGLTLDNIDAFVRGLDIVVDAMDSAPMKLALREAASRHGVTVVMGTDVELGVVDLEPYREDSAYLPFHGLLSQSTLEFLRDPTTPRNHPRMMMVIAEIIGLENLSAQAIDMGSALMSGKLASMSQLASTATAVGGVVARLIHLYLCGQPVRSGRTVLRIESSLLENYSSPKANEARQTAMSRLFNTLSGGDTTLGEAV